MRPPRIRRSKSWASAAGTASNRASRTTIMSLLRERGRANPRGVPEIAQRRGRECEPLSGEALGFGRLAAGSERTRSIQSIGPLDVLVRVADMPERLFEPRAAPRLRGRDEVLEVPLLERRVDVVGLEAAVDPRAGIAVRVRRRGAPAVDVDRRVQRLAGIGDEVAEKAGDVDDVLLDLPSDTPLRLGYGRRFTPQHEVDREHFGVLGDGIGRVAEVAVPHRAASEFRLAGELEEVLVAVRRERRREVLENDRVVAVGQPAQRGLALRVAPAVRLR